MLRTLSPRLFLLLAFVNMGFFAMSVSNDSKVSMFVNLTTSFFCMVVYTIKKNGNKDNAE